jgi:glycolate oxidase iron-sulfur subunit
MRSLNEGRIGLTPNVIQHLDLCLQCRACEAACPSGVPYGRIMERARSQVLRHESKSPIAWRLRSMVLREIVGKPGRLKLAMALAGIYERSGMRSLLRKSGVLKFAPRLEHMEGQLPSVQGQYFPKDPVYRPKGAALHKVAILSGCVMPYMYGRVNKATVDVLLENGCEVRAPLSQGCCGALQAHAGDLETARKLARNNIDALLAEDPDAIIINSAGCGAAMKEYAELLHEDPDYAEKAARFSALCRDISEYLVEIGFKQPQGQMPVRVTYQDSCHLGHAQRVRTQPRDVLISIPGVEFVEMPSADRCCGSAGIYSAVQPEMSSQILSSKMTDIGTTNAGVIATANPGCMLQLEAGVRRSGVPMRVAHVVELLAESYAKQPQ